MIVLWVVPVLIVNWRLNQISGDMNQTKKVTFSNCPPKYCCDVDPCKNYKSRHGNRTGTLCGKCSRGTKCTPNQDCASVSFWIGFLTYLISYSSWYFISISYLILYLCIFPSSHLPREGFLILRRLALILTFVYVHVKKATLSMILCVVILLVHVFVKLFKTTRENVFETLSLGTLIIISEFSLLKSCNYYGKHLDSNSLSFLKMMITLMENILIILPAALIICFLMFVILYKVISLMFGCCFRALFRRKKCGSAENYTPKEIRSLL